MIKKRRVPNCRKRQWLKYPRNRCNCSRPIDFWMNVGRSLNFFFKLFNSRCICKNNLLVKSWKFFIYRLLYDTSLNDIIKWCISILQLKIYYINIWIYTYLSNKSNSTFLCTVNHTVFSFSRVSNKAPSSVNREFPFVIVRQFFWLTKIYKATHIF